MFHKQNCSERNNIRNLFLTPRNRVHLIQDTPTGIKYAFLFAGGGCSIQPPGRPKGPSHLGGYRYSNKSQSRLKNITVPSPEKTCNNSLKLFTLKIVLIVFSISVIFITVVFFLRIVIVVRAVQFARGRIFGSLRILKLEFA